MMVRSTNASLAHMKWDTLDWDTMEVRVKQLQMRIAKAIREGRYRKASALQWILTHSLHAKLLAIKRVTQNRGNKTAGVDNVIWQTPNQKLGAVSQLSRRGYNALPLRRVYIPKKNGKLRPLSIPTMKDRAMQAVHLLALEPVAETIADKNAYGFRPNRSCADAIEQCFRALCMKSSAQWVLEGDIKSCFDKINHQWLQNNVPMDKLMLNKWLKSGFVELQQLHETTEGVPQGGIISPTLLTITLSGLEKAILAATKRQDKVNIVSYADDFIITGATRKVLELTVKPIVVKFLKKRGLELSKEKTLITHIDQGFDFLGFNVRKYKNKLLIKPSKKNVNTFLSNIRNLIKAEATAKTENLIYLLNPKIRGWANYYRHVVAKATFGMVDHEIFQAIWRWAKRRHPNKSSSWVYKKYFCTIEYDAWVFNAGIKPYQGRFKLLRLIKASSTPIKRHIKIRAEATPYDPKYIEYLEKRRTNSTIRQ